MLNTLPMTKLSQRSRSRVLRLSSHDQNEKPAICRQARRRNHGRYGCITYPIATRITIELTMAQTSAQ